MIKVKDLLLSCGNLEIECVRIHNNKYDIAYADINKAIEECGSKSVIIFKIEDNLIDILVSKND